MNRTHFLLACILVVIAPPTIRADAKSYAVRETAEFVMKQFGREALQEGAEALSRKIGGLASRFGDDALVAFRKIGPRVSSLADDAGENAPLALRLLAGHGDNAIRMVAHPKQLGLVARFGDEAAECLLKHGDVAEPLLQSYGLPAAKALGGISTRNGRRVSMMMAEPRLAEIGRSDELLGVISRFGDAGADFIWQNKGALAVGVGMTAFLRSPEKFIHGGTDLASVAAEAAVKPIAIAVADATPWPTVEIFAFLAIVVAAAIAWLRMGGKRAPASQRAVEHVNKTHLP